MYTNIDTFNNMQTEFEARINLNKPDIIVLTEVNPKNSRWTLETSLHSLDVQTLSESFDHRVSGNDVSSHCLTLEV